VRVRAGILDHQVRGARAAHAGVGVALGRRLPGGLVLRLFLEESGTPVDGSEAAEPVVDAVGDHLEQPALVQVREQHHASPSRGSRLMKDEKPSMLPPCCASTWRGTS